MVKEGLTEVTVFQEAAGQRAHANADESHKIRTSLRACWRAELFRGVELGQGEGLDGRLFQLRRSDGAEAQGQSQEFVTC